MFLSGCKPELCSGLDLDGSKAREMTTPQKIKSGQKGLWRLEKTTYFHSPLSHSPTHSISSFSAWMQSPVGFSVFCFYLSIAVYESPWRLALAVVVGQGMKGKGRGGGGVEKEGGRGGGEKGPV